MHFRRLPPIPNTLRQFSLTLTRRHSSQLRSLHRVMSSSSSSLSSSDLARKWLTPAFLDDVHEHWFTGYSPNDPLPSQEWWQRCFMKSEENDRFCREKYLPFFEDVQRADPTPQDLIADPFANPKTTLTVIILLDQISRNVFRGAESKLVFTIYDNLALDISLRALFPNTYQHVLNQEGTSTTSTKTPWYLSSAATSLHPADSSSSASPSHTKTPPALDTIPAFRHHLGYRAWFYLPLMHSESLRIHDWAQLRFDALAADMSSLSSASTTEPFIRSFHAFENLHRDLILRFGRYPHRNAVLGRPETPEERAYLLEGGMTFGS